MSNDLAQDKSTTPIANALREAGFIPLPRLWVKREDIHEIHAIAEKHRKAVNAIRGQVRESHPDLDDRYQPKVTDPKLDKDAAWKQFEKLQNRVSATTGG